MSTTRVFLLASALARLIEKERGGDLVRQGFFPDRTGRSAHVQVAGETGYLILVSQPSTSPLEEPAEISRAQAEALLDLTAGRTEYLSIPIDIGSHSATIQRYVTPASLDLISVAFKHDKAARKFQPPVWFGSEVTSEPSYQLRSLALTGLPSTPEVDVTNEASTACSIPWVTVLASPSRSQLRCRACPRHPRPSWMLRRSGNWTGSTSRTA